MLNRNERGFTLVEVLVAVAITSLLSVAIARVIDTTQNALLQSSSRSIVSTQALRFGDVLRYDLLGASDVYLYGATAPSDQSNVCSSWSTTNGTSWTDPSSATFVRPLFTVMVPTVTPPSAPTSEGPFLTSRVQRIGYEIRNDGNNYGLLRVDCDANGQAQRLLSLGTPLPSDVTGLSVLRCLTVDGTVIVPSAGTSTMSTSVPLAQRCATFSFTLPDSATPLLRQLVQQRAQRMGSGVTRS